jgi:hypothetical protein
VVESWLIVAGDMFRLGVVGAVGDAQAASARRAAAARRERRRDIL